MRAGAFAPGYGGVRAARFSPLSAGEGPGVRWLLRVDEGSPRRCAPGLSPLATVGSRGALFTSPLLPSPLAPCHLAP